MACGLMLSRDRSQLRERCGQTDRREGQCPSEQGEVDVLLLAVPGLCLPACTLPGPQAVPVWAQAWPSRCHGSHMCPEKTWPGLTPLAPGI